MTSTHIEPLAVPITEAAQILGIGRTSFYGLLKADQVKMVKMGRRTVIPMASLRSYVERKTGEAA